MADQTVSSIEAPKPPAKNPISGSASSDAATIKLKPVIRKPVIGGAKPAFKMPSKPLTASAPAPVAPASQPAAPVAESSDKVATVPAVDQLKSITQKLKGVTQQIPQQAILHKTGIIAEQQLTDAQKLASKSRTARISLSDAIGASPVQNEAAPMKTIRIKRPVDLNSAPTAVDKPAAPITSESTENKPKDNVSVTQRKTLKISRPGVVRPAGKFAPKKPAEASASAVDNAQTEVAEIPEVADIPATNAPVAPMVAKSIDDNGGVPDGVVVLDTILQFAACVAIALLGAFIYFFDYSRNWF